MKILKFASIFLMIFFSSEFIYSQETRDNLEIGIYNHTSSLIKIQLYPISQSYRIDGKCSQIALHRSIPNQNPDYGVENYYDYNNGASYQIDENEQYTSNFEYIVSPLDLSGWNDDIQGANTKAKGTFGFGNYKLIVTNLSTGRVDSCLI